MYAQKLINNSASILLVRLIVVIIAFLAFNTNTTAQISGYVFRDFNANGTRNTGPSYNEPLVDGITVKAYDASNTLLATVTSVAGAYSFTAMQIPATTKVRLEFSGWVNNVDYPGAYGTHNKSSIQFATAPASSLGFGINYPGDYIDAPNARIIVPSYANGNNQVPGPYPNAASADNVYSFNYGSAAATDVISDMGQIGAVWATAYSRKADKVFYASFVKRHVSLGPLGMNGLYVTTSAKTTTNTSNTSSFVDLNAINPAFDAGTLPGRSFAPGNQNKTQANRDDKTIGNVFDEVGKKGMGGMAISDDGRYLYVINLNDRKLWRVDIGTNGTAPTLTSQIVSYNAFPVAAGNSTFRPFAVKFYRGDIYIGGVLDGVKPDNSSVDRTELKAVVLKVSASVTPGTETFTTVLDAPLTYQRRANMNTGFGVNKNSNYVDPNGTIAAATLCQGSWHPWARTFTEVVIPPGSDKIIYPQPMFSSLDFDPSDGAMILGITDRSGHQSGNANLAPTSMGNNTLYTANAAGDILKATNNGTYTSFTLESNGTSGSLTTNGAGNNEGPGGGEFFFTDRYEGGAGGALGIGNTANGTNVGTSHEETSTGSIAMFPGKELIATAFDPITDWYTGGIRYYSTQDGIAKNGKALYQGGDVSVFGKANGLGDIEIISAPAPIEIGNRVWLDADGNGVQDAGELPIAGVTVELVKAGLVIATAITDVDGNYIFSSDPNGVSTASAIYNIAGLTPNTAFTVRVPNVTGGSKQAALGTNDLTTADIAPGANADEIDSDGLLVGSHAEVNLTTGVAGANNHSYDFGFTTSVPSGGGGGLESKSLGDAVGRRVFNKAVNSLQGTIDYKNFPGVEIRNIQNRVNGVGTSLSLAELLPQQIKGTNYKAFKTTPTDLISITNAVDVMSIDFTLNNQAKAVSFATKTQGEVYDHTKAICDRLKGAELMGIQKMVIDNVAFIRYDLKNAQGQVEYAMSFAVGAKSGRSNYTIQSNWLNKDYTPDQVMYNVQLWAVSPELVVSMATDILTRLKANMPVTEQANNKLLPTTYVTKGKRDAENLVLNVFNASSNTNGYLEVFEKANEQTSVITKKQIPFTVASNGSVMVKIPASDTYEATIHLYMNGVMQDQLFMADGNWVVNVNAATSTLNNFIVENDSNRILDNKEDFLLFRNVKVEASSPDYVSVYKLLRGGGAAQNLTGYKSLVFNAKGLGVDLKITLVKEGIQNWDDQYQLKIPMTNNAKDYKINLNDFVSKASKEKINPNDITTVVFALEVHSGKLTNISADFSKVAFSKTDFAYLNSLNSKEISIYPNPSRGKLNASFKSPESTKLTLFLTEASTGKTVFSKPVNAVVGMNIVPIEFTQNTGLNTYILSLEGNGIKYQPQKVLIEK